VALRFSNALIERFDGDVRGRSMYARIICLPNRARRALARA
jgi:hypothetical protein